MRLEQLALTLELLEALAQFVLDADDCVAHAVLAGHVVRGREHDELVDLVEALTGERVDHDDLFDLVAEELDAHHSLVVGRVNLDDVAPHSELAADQVQVVALVLHVDQLAEDGALIALLALVEHQQLTLVLDRRTEPVDTRHRCNDDGVASREERRRRGVAQPVDLVVDRAVLFDVRVGRGHVGLGLVVVVVGHEVLNPVIREELAQLVGQLRGQRLIGRDDERGLLHLFDGPRDGRTLARPGDAEQRLEAIAPAEPFGELGDSRGLVARWLEIGHDLERPVAGVRSWRAGVLLPGHPSMLPTPCASAPSPN